MREVPCKYRYLKILGLALATLAGVAPVLAAAPEVTPSRDLSADARLAEQRALPILLTFSSSSCGYCEQLEREILKPMLISGDYEDKVLIRKVMIDGHRTLIDFDGGAVDGAELAQRYDINMVPTVVLVDGQGRELAERMVGVSTLEFYAGYLDQNIDLALQRLRGGRTAALATGFRQPIDTADDPNR